MNLGDQLQVFDVIPIASVNASGNGAGVDLEQVEGEIAIILDCNNTAGSTPTMDIKLQDSADNSTGWGDISGAAFTQVTTSASVQKLSLDSNQIKRYVRAVKTIGGTSSPAFLVSVKAVGLNKYLA